jgi:hypothetical protein
MSDDLPSPGAAPKPAPPAPSPQAPPGAPPSHVAAADPAPDHVPGLTPAPQPGTHLPEQPGKEVSADAHEEEHVPIIGFVDHRIAGVDGTPINVHTPGVILPKQPPDAPA